MCEVWKIELLFVVLQLEAILMGDLKGDRTLPNVFMKEEQIKINSKRIRKGLTDDRSARTLTNNFKE